jgi:FtsZ-binding cell division protein ZapB|tara:strand:+ start:5154 stop:5657 length:504 start_codon:yes stop_codon:yes gene_type:complete
MLRVYILIVVVMAVAGIGYGAKYYYDTTQATIATLRENNAKLEGAVKTAEASLALLQDNIVKLSKLNKNLQADLQKAEAYGDELRVKLNRLNLVQEALRDAKVLEGKMNGATAKLWRNLMDDTGNPNEYDLPSWLQPLPAGTGDQNSDESGEGSDTDSIEAETSSTN